jgi:TetR/AcrR family transcriptional repressor of nem operon
MANLAEADRSARAKVLQRAMYLFWERGAETSSYGEIVAATGLSRKALYSAWPDKDALVREAMALYRETVLAPMLAPLDDGGRKGLERFWEGIEAGVRLPGWSGCFLFRSAGGAYRADPVVARHFTEHVELLRRGIGGAVLRAQQAGELTAGIDPEHASWQTVSVAALLSTYGALSGFSPAVAQLVAAGRAACGLSPSPADGAGENS